MVYITKSRVLPSPPRKWRYNLPRFPDIVKEVPVQQATVWVDPSQITYTSATDVSDPLRDLSDESRVLRSGASSLVGNRKVDKGHEFWTTKTSMWLSHPDYFSRSLSSAGPYWFRGPLIPRVASLAPHYVDPLTGNTDTSRRDPFPAIPTDNDVAGLGSTAISRCAPGAPQANIVQALAELVQDIPAVPILSLLRPGARPNRLGGEYLNVQFGILPTVKDFRTIVETLRNWTKLLTQPNRDEGRVVRRKYSFPTSVTSTEDQHYVELPLYEFPGDYVANEARNKLSKVVRTTRAVWFAGAFSYYVPMPPGMDNRFGEFVSKADAILGLRLTPETLWELAPWSWLIDWASNVGDVISNAQRLNDGLVIRYGYLMVKTKTDHIWSTLPGLKTWDGEDLPVAQVHFTRLTKRRYRATPFGFATEWDGLSPSQWAILAALGITRTR